ncbi:MAE_28990/MAE_18760 family HEPN-like nuclease [Chryseobacterium sp.]|uniref:MAE_28990/MAE_18760 family HEPN-like nuclease n=1 Tax=Chryseobacterium sp. TaxID=1871047 RepID=UPI002FC69552
MLQIRQSFADKVAEINLYYKLLSDIITREAQLIFPNENDIRENFNVKVSSILKSSANLQLYNLVESTISNCLVEIHSSFTNESILYEDLSDEIQKLWVKFHYDYFKGTSNEKDILHNLKALIDTWVTNRLPVTLTYQEFTKYNTGGNFSGNLDSKEIIKLSEKYGIDFDIKCDEIGSIKSRRNKLAHGEVSFEELGRQDSIEYMKVLKDKVVDFLTQFIQAVDNYITNTKYRRIV